MNQIDYFEKDLEKEFKKLDSWMRRIRRRMQFLEQVYVRTRKNIPEQIPSPKIKQLNFFY